MHRDGGWRVRRARIHDLKESATALAVCLNLPDRLVREESEKVATRVKGLNHEERMSLFRKALNDVAVGEDGRRFQRAVVQLCWDMAYADGVLEDSERVYLDLPNPCSNPEGQRTFFCAQAIDFRMF